MATMHSGLGGPAGYGANSILTSGVDSGNLDDGSIQIDLTPIFGASGIDFYGSSYTNIYINTNGLLTFDSPEHSYHPVGLSGYDSPAIAPFWSDVDISKGGDIYWDVDTVTGKLTVTWLDVAPYQGSGTNSFQIVLTDTGSGDFDVEFVYEDIQWVDGFPRINATATAGITDGGTNDTDLEGSGDESFMSTYATNDFDNGDPAGIFHLSVSDGTVQCFAEGTRILTAQGPRPVEKIGVGDLLQTQGYGMQPVLWKGSHRVDGLSSPGRKHLRPVLLRKGAVGNHSPLRVSPQHGVAIAGALVRAGHLVTVYGGQVARIDKSAESVRFFHLLTPRHSLIKAEGAWVETFYPGSEGLDNLGRGALARLHKALPVADYGPPVLPYLTRKTLAQRDPLKRTTPAKTGSGRISQIA